MTMEIQLLFHIEKIMAHTLLEQLAAADNNGGIVGVAPNVKNHEPTHPI